MADNEVQEVSDQQFEADVIKSDKPVLVAFWAPWCGPCRMVAPVVKELAGEYEGKLEFRKLNTDENPMVSARYNIRSIPTLLVFKDGKQVEQIVGFRPKAAIKERLDAALAGTATKS
jgi:thioredoxin 1